MMHGCTTCGFETGQWHCVVGEMRFRQLRVKLNIELVQGEQNMRWGVVELL